jgi:hypothetical protein
MGLENVLDDIKGDVDNISTEGITPENISTENIEITSIKQNSLGMSIDRISKETINKINTMFNLVIVKNNVDKLQRVDYAIAQEVFTMLPEVPKSEQAKLTANPTINNKEILARVFNSNIDNKYSVDVHEKISNLRDLIEQNLDKFEAVYSYLNIFKGLVESKLTVLNEVAPMVIERKYNLDSEENQNKNINLLEEKIADIVYLDDSKMEYEKYTGVLVEKYSNLYHDNGLKELGTIENYLSLSVVSLKTFVSGINAIESSLKSKEAELNNYISGLRSVYNKEVEINAETIEFINGYDSVAFNLEYLSKVYEVTKLENNCFDKVVDLINFLD